MARIRPANAQRQHPQSGTEIDTTWKKEARTAKDDMATDSNGRAERDAWGCHGVRFRSQLKTGPCGERLL